MKLGVGDRKSTQGPKGKGRVSGEAQPPRVGMMLGAAEGNPPMPPEPSEAMNALAEAREHLGAQAQAKHHVFDKGSL